MQLHNLGPYGITKLLVSFGKSNTVLLALDRLVQNLIFALFSLSQLIFSNSDINSNSISCARINIHKCGIVIRILCKGCKTVCQFFVILAVQSIKCCRCSLYYNILPCQICQCLNSGIGSDYHNLLVIQIWIRPCIIILTSIDGKAIPDTVNISGIQLHILGIPVNWFLYKLPSKIITYLLCHIQVKTNIFATFIHITKRRVLCIKSNSQGLTVGICINSHTRADTCCHQGTHHNRQHSFFHNIYPPEI